MTGQRGLSFVTYLSLLDRRFVEIASIAPEIATPLFAQFTPQLLSKHISVQLFGNPGEVKNQEISQGDKLTEANLTAYVREKLSDPIAEASKVVSLPGGFGKETTLFTLKSRTLNADMVMRRDSPIDHLEGLDCHTAPKEYPLLKAVHARGFSAPEPLFFEEASQTIKGPAFSIMRRVPGAVAGDATGGTGQVSIELQRTLAEVTARLHNIAELTELAHITAFSPSLWKLTASQCTRNYIQSWYEQYKKIDHLPTPALHGLLNWLLDHIPSTDEPSTLVHGDIGFHNLLFSEGKLSAVLDWEFAHVGDPAEDIGYIRSVMGAQLDWPQFINAYGNAGRTIPDEKRIRFFEIWSNVRNATSSVMVTNNFEVGRFRNIRYGLLPFRYVPHFISRAQALIENYDMPETN